METYYILIVLCSLIICSYLFDMVSRAIRLPSALLLIATGICLKFGCDYYKLTIGSVEAILPALGTLGLILIVLEGALELQFTKDKVPVIRKSFFAALFILLISWLAITGIILRITEAGLRVSMLNAVPYAVISSAIAIPSVAGLTTQKKEFIVYESSFSDILGIVLFNFLSANEEITGTSFLFLSRDIVLVLLIAVLFSLLLLYMMGRISHHVKFFLLIAILILVYALGKIYHLSTLVIVLVFGLLLNNAALVQFNFFKKHFLYDGLDADLKQFFNLTAESAFLMRTFFFIVFGFTLQLALLQNISTLFTGLLFFLTLVFIRFIYLRLFAKSELSPALYIMPRGLISILLFYSIPAQLQIEGLGQAPLLFIVIATALFMTTGLLFIKKPEQEASA
ncbi:MAG: cation:proton antiporter [Chitinophagales bacterium]